MVDRMNVKFSLVPMRTFENWLGNKIMDVVHLDGSPIDDNNALGVFSVFRTKDYPELISKMIEETGYSDNYCGFGFGEIQDGGIIYVPEGMVELYGAVNSQNISNKDFFVLSLQFAKTALEAIEVFDLKNKRIVDDNWIKSVQEAIPKLEKKIIEYSS